MLLSSVDALVAQAHLANTVSALANMAGGSSDSRRQTHEEGQSALHCDLLLRLPKPMRAVALTGVRQCGRAIQYASLELRAER